MGRRDEIINCAAKVFERKGVSRTSVEDIATEVGVTREAVYYYFKSRAEILLEVVLPQSRTLLKSAQAIMRTDLGCEEKLHGLIRSHLDSFDPNYFEMNVALREDHFFKDDRKLDELRRTWDAYSEIWTQLIVEGQEKGLFKPNLDAKMVAFGLFGMCNWVSRWYDPEGDVTIPEIIETFAAMATGGISARS